MALWTNDYLSRLWLEGETEIAQKTKCLVDRISLATTNGIAEYQLPDYVFNVKRVYWKGERLTPIFSLDGSVAAYDILSFADGAFEFHSFTPAYLTGQLISTPMIGSGVNSGKPLEYYYYGFGENKIRLNPGANENLNLYSDGLWSNNIDKALIVEFYRFPDETHQIPQYIRRRTIKAYVMAKAFAKEGDGQNINASQYWSKRYALLLNRAMKIIDRVYQAYKPAVGGQDSSCCQPKSDYGYQGPTKPPRPVLPPNYGIVVEDDCC